MGSSDSNSTPANAMMPLVGILRHELRSLSASWLVRLWLAAACAISLFLTAAGWEKLQTAPLVGLLLSPFLVAPWFLVVMVLGVTPMSGGRAEEMADGILCRPITRYEYLVAAWLARVVLVLGVFLIVLVPTSLMVTLAKRPVPDDSVTVHGVCSAIGVVGLVLMFQVSFGFLLGTALRNTLLAVAVLMCVWFPINAVLDKFSLESFSPISLNRAMPQLLRGDEPSAESWLDQISSTFAIPKSNPDPRFFKREGYDDFSLRWVVFGYATATLVSISLATAIFGFRDL